MGDDLGRPIQSLGASQGLGIRFHRGSKPVLSKEHRALRVWGVRFWVESLGVAKDLRLHGFWKGSGIFFIRRRPAEYQQQDRDKNGGQYYSPAEAQ